MSIDNCKIQSQKKCNRFRLHFIFYLLLLLSARIDITIPTNKPMIIIIRVNPLFFVRISFVPETVYARGLTSVVWRNQ